MKTWLNSVSMEYSGSNRTNLSNEFALILFCPTSQGTKNMCQPLCGMSSSHRCPALNGYHGYLSPCPLLVLQILSPLSWSVSHFVALFSNNVLNLNPKVHTDFRKNVSIES